MVRYHIFSPGGNSTALITEPVAHDRRALLVSALMASDPRVEQVGFLVAEAGPGYDAHLEMMGDEFCVNALRSAAFYYAAKYGKKTIIFKTSGFHSLVEARVMGGQVAVSFLSGLIVEQEKIEEGMLVTMQGITFVVTDNPHYLEKPSLTIAKYDNGSVPAIGLIGVSRRSPGHVTIDPWVYVRATKSLCHESGCGSGSIAAALALAELGEHHVTVEQPSGSAYSITFDGATIVVQGTVTTLGEKTLFNAPEEETMVTNLFSKPVCLYCGNNPVPHHLTWLNTNSVIVMTPMNEWLAQSRIGRFFNWLTEVLLFGMLHTFRLFGFVKFYNKKEDCTIMRAKALWEDAELRGITMEGATFLGRPIDFYRATINGKIIYFNGLPRPKQSDSSALLWMDDKALLKQKLQAAGIAVSPGGSYSDFETLRNDFQKLQKPVIIKPRLGSRGRHTTTHIYTEDELRQAFTVAKALCHWVVMEEHLIGNVYRGTLINGKLRGVLGGSPPRVTGDGVHTIAELIARQNQLKPVGVKDIQINQAMIEFLARTGLTLQSVVPQHQVVDVIEKVGVGYGGSSFEITGETHPAIKAELERAAAVVGDVLLGFDFIIPNITASPDSQRWGIIECNGVPFINLHHYPLHGKPNPVARYVWEMVENG